jgi:hypothetical protein
MGEGGELGTVAKGEVGWRPRYHYGTVCVQEVACLDARRRQDGQKWRTMRHARTHVARLPPDTLAARECLARWKPSCTYPDSTSTTQLFSWAVGGTFSRPITRIYLQVTPSQETIFDINIDQITEFASHALCGV